MNPDKDKPTPPNLSIFKYLQESKSLIGSQSNVKTAEEFTQLHNVDQTLKFCTTATVASLIAKMQKSTASNKEKTNYLFANEIINAALCHMKYVQFRFFLDGLEQITDEKLRVHLKNLCALNGLCHIQECMTAGYDAGWLQKGDNGLIQDAIN